MIHSLRNSKFLMFLIFIFFLLVNIITAGGHLDPWDGIEAFLVTESMVLKHTAKLDPTVPSIEKLHFNVRYTVYSNKVIQTKKFFNQSTITLEPVYTVRSLLLSASAVPFYYAALLLSISPLVTIALFVNSFLISLTCVVVFCFSLELYGSRKMLAFVQSLIFGVCSFVLPYHTSFWAQPLQALTLVSSAYFIYKSLHYNPSFLCYYFRPSHSDNGNTTNKNNKTDWIHNKGIFYAGLGGLFLGLSVFSHATSIVLIPGFVLYCFLSTWRTRNLGVLCSFITLLGVVLFLIGVINYLRFGSFTEFGYGYFGSLAVHDGWRGLVGLLISPGASLFLYFPVSIFVPLATKCMYDKKENRRLLFLFLYTIIVSWLDAGTLSFNFEPFSWWGTGWGPRYLLPVLPFVTLMLGSVFLRIKTKKGFMISRSLLKFSIIVLSIAGFYISVIGTIVWWQYDIVYVGAQKEEHANKDPWNSIVWDPKFSPVALHTKMLLADYIAHIKPDNYVNTSWQWVTYGLAPCSYDMYIFCKFGFSPVLLIALVISALGALIVNQIRGGTIYFIPRNFHHRRNYKKSSL